MDIILKTKDEFYQMTIQNLKQYIFNFDLIAKQEKQKGNEDQYKIIMSNLDICKSVLSEKEGQEKRRKGRYENE